MLKIYNGNVWEFCTTKDAIRDTMDVLNEATSRSKITRYDISDEKYLMVMMIRELVKIRELLEKQCEE